MNVLGAILMVIGAITVLWFAVVMIFVVIGAGRIQQQEQDQEEVSEWNDHVS